MNSLSRAVMATVCTGILLATSTVSAAGEVLEPEARSESLWNATRWLDYAATHQSGVGGEGITIAVVDEAVNPDIPELAGANLTVRGTTCIDSGTGAPKDVVSADPTLASHGTNVVSMIAGNGAAGDGGAGALGAAPGADVWFYGVGPVGELDDCELQDPTVPEGGIDLSRDISVGPDVYENPDGDGDATALAARAAIRDGAEIVSVSVLSGLVDWEQVLIEAQLAGVIVVTGTPNPGTPMGFVGGPWLTNGALPVSAIDVNGEQLTDPVSGEVGSTSSMMGVAAPGVDLLGVGSDEEWGATRIDGTSYGAPMVAGVLALAMQEHPDATGFQVLQSLVRTTGAGATHEAIWNDHRFGFGYANPKALLAQDPTEFPDANPMFVDDIDDPRCAAPDGTAGRIDESDPSKWLCEWSLGPFPPIVERYRSVVQDGTQVLNLIDEKVDSVYAQAADAPSGPVPAAWPTPLLVLGGSILLLMIITTVVVLVILGRRRTRNTPGGHDARI